MYSNTKAVPIYFIIIFELNVLEICKALKITLQSVVPIFFCSYILIKLKTIIFHEYLNSGELLQSSRHIRDIKLM